MGLAIVTVGLAMPSKPAHAADYSNNNMIDNEVFDDVNSMTEAQIQSFLASKGPCLANYYDVDPNWNGSTWSYSGSVLASHIIYKSAQMWGLNPQVILATLQKEESLITGTSCDAWRYQSAMGYGCPDSGGCNSKYAGLTHQVLWGSWQLMFGRQRADGNTAWDGDGGITYVGYMTQGNRARCDGCTVNYYDGYATIDGQSLYLDNGATASLYNYTPHLNQSFPGIFESWFGPVTLINGTIQLAQGLQLSNAGNGHIGDTLTASYQVKNTGSSDVNAGDLGVCARMNGQWYDFGFNTGQVIPAGGTTTISFSKTLDTPGSLSVFTCSYNASMGGWVSQTYPYDYTGTMARQATVTVLDNPLVTSGITLSPANPVAGQVETATVTISNSSSNPVNIGDFLVAARDPYGTNVDFPADTNVTIPAGSSYTYSKSRALYSAGNYSIFTADLRGSTWSRTYPSSANTSISRSMNLSVADNPIITSGISLSPSNPAIGQPVTATVSMHNSSTNPVSIGYFVVAARDPNGNNVDFPGVANLTVPAGGTYTYSQSRTFNMPGSHSLFIADFNGTSWSMSYPKSADSSVVRQQTINVLDNPLITSGVSLSPANPAVGQTATATFTIHNASANAVSLGYVVVAARDPNGNNVDFPGISSLSIPAGSDYTYSQSRTFNTPGTHNFFIADFNGSAWSRDYPKSVNSGIVRQMSANVLDNPLITSGISLSPATPVAGQPVTATFTIHNASASAVNIGYMVVAARDPNGNNVDFPGDSNISIPAGSDYVYSKSETFSTPGVYSLFIANFNGASWSRDYPKSSSSAIVRQTAFVL